MKNFTFTKALIFGLFLGQLSVAVAADRGSNTASALLATPTHADTERFALGIQTLNQIGGSNTALSGLVELDEQRSFQGVFAIGGTKPFQFGGGVAFRGLITGSRNLGIHAGGMLQMGQVLSGGTTRFYTTIAPLAGIQFTIPHLTSILIFLDATAQFQITGGELDFAVKGLSPALGLGIHYFF